MYGMIHRALRHMVSEQLGEEAWKALEKKLNIGPTELLTAMAYDDALTFRIVAEAADRLNLSSDECLFAFGSYWVRYADQGPLASIMNFTGATLPSFIANLDRLHLAVGAAMPGTRLPTFYCFWRVMSSICWWNIGPNEPEWKSSYADYFNGLMEKFNVVGTVELIDWSAPAIHFETSL